MKKEEAIVEMEKLCRQDESFGELAEYIRGKLIKKIARKRKRLVFAVGYKMHMTKDQEQILKNYLKARICVSWFHYRKLLMRKFDLLCFSIFVFDMK